MICETKQKLMTAKRKKLLFSIPFKGGFTSDVPVRHLNVNVGFNLNCTELWDAFKVSYLIPLWNKDRLLMLTKCMICGSLRFAPDAFYIRPTARYLTFLVKEHHVN